MKTLYAALALTLLTRACGGEPDPVPPVGAAPPAAQQPTSFAMNAMHGGSVLLVEDQYVEVVPKSDGMIEAYVLGPSAPGAVAITPSNVTVKIQGDDGAPHDVPLVWSPSSSRFEGRLVAARPAPGPIEVTVIAPDRPAPRRARAPQVVVVAALPPPVGAPPVVVVPAPHAPGVVVVPPSPPGVVVVPPSPTVVVAPPPPGVVVVPPSPPGVVVVPPTPGVVVVEEHGHGHGRGHEIGRGHGHDDERGVVVVGPAPHPGAVVVGPRTGAVVVSPRPAPVVVAPSRPGVVVVGGGGRGDHGHGGHGGH